MEANTMLKISIYDVECFERFFDSASHQEETVPIDGIQLVNVAASAWIEVHSKIRTINFVYPGGRELVLKFREQEEFLDTCEKLGRNV
ncbi:hypothetical protein [Litorisediminicola beolgyonensis]|uniref:Uncharacterized protein n=1 Tax=Litorisediminicola beolgyonensis TaxID=1173614 RepID=A0ABW3ZJU1_9RHOB